MEVALLISSKNVQMHPWPDLVPLDAFQAIDAIRIQIWQPFLCTSTTKWLAIGVSNWNILGLDGQMSVKHSSKHPPRWALQDISIHSFVRFRDFQDPLLTPEPNHICICIPPSKHIYICMMDDAFLHGTIMSFHFHISPSPQAYRHLIIQSTMTVTECDMNTRS